jgi:hypothetical protein
MLGSLHATAEQRALRAARFTAEATESASRFAPPPKTVAHPATFVGYSEDKRSALIKAARARLAGGEKLGSAQRATLQALGVTDEELMPGKKQKSAKRAKAAAAAAAAEAAAAAAAAAEAAAVPAAAAKRGRGAEAPPAAAERKLKRVEPPQEALPAAPAPAPAPRALSRAEQRLLDSLPTF